jgi:hypothetical protein
MSEMVKLSVFRYDPESGDQPFMQAYEVPMLKPGMKLLDALNYIKWELDGTILPRRRVWFRWFKYQWRQRSCLYYPCCRFEAAGTCASLAEHECDS